MFRNFAKLQFMSDLARSIFQVSNDRSELPFCFSVCWFSVLSRTTWAKTAA